VKSGPRRLDPIERRAHDEVRARAAGIRVADLTPDTVAVDEILGTGQGVEFSHRIAAGRGGTYRPANGIWTSRAVHDFLHDNRGIAEAGGWHLETGTCVQAAPVWLARPHPGWWLINDLVTDGGPHVLEWCDIQPPRPRLPFESQAAYAAAALLLLPA
jgi:hypothetical protein